jgi:hypothetical protein
MRHAKSGQRPLFLPMVLLLPAISAFFLWLEHRTHVEFLLHVAAIPLEILVGAFLVERWIARSEREAKLRQLLYLKSYLFRSEMRNVFVSNFAGLARPAIPLAWIRGASLEQLMEARDGITTLEYRSDEDLELIIGEYVRARHVFQTFMEWAVANDFEPIFHDMIDILHFIQDVERFRERNPGRLFVAEARRHPRLQEKLEKILRDGVVKFLDYAIELHEKEPEVLEELLEDYLLSSRMLGGPGSEPGGSGI